MTARRLLRCATVVTVAVLVVAIGTGGPVGAAATRATAPEQYCARLVSLQDQANAVTAATSGSETFAAIGRLAKAYRAAAADAPEMIADDMEVLASSISELERALRPLRKTIRPARTQAAYDRMMEKLRAAIAGWADDQDAEAVSAAQTAVDDWTADACGFHLSQDAGGSGATGATTATTVPVTTGR